MKVCTKRVGSWEHNDCRSYCITRQIYEIEPSSKLWNGLFILSAPGRTPPPPTAHPLSLPWAVCLALPQELRINLRSVPMLQLDALFFVCSEGSSSWHVTWCYVVMSNPTPFSLVGGICYERLEWRVLLHSLKLEIFLGHLRRLAVTFVYEHFNFHIYSKT